MINSQCYCSKISIFFKTPKFRWIWPVSHSSFFIIYFSYIKNKHCLFKMNNMHAYKEGNIIKIGQKERKKLMSSRKKEKERRNKSKQNIEKKSCVCLFDIRTIEASVRVG